MTVADALESLSKMFGHQQDPDFPKSILSNPNLLAHPFSKIFPCYVTTYVDFGVGSLVLFAYTANAVLTMETCDFLDVGVEDGGSTLAILYGLDYGYKQRPGSRIPRSVSIDQFEYPQARAAVTLHGLEHYWDYRVNKAMACLPTKESTPLGFYFHDAEHDYNSVHSEISCMLHRLVKGSVVASHDAHPGSAPWNALTDIAGKYGFLGPYDMSHSISVIRKI